MPRIDNKMMDRPFIKSQMQRFGALDWLRGFAVAGMIVVTSPGDWNHTYAPLLHADWNGWTLADMVFPTFLFAVGLAFGLSFPKFIAAPEDRSRVVVRIARRAVALIALGLVLNWIYVEAIGWGAWFPGKAGLANIRLSGVPQRIAVCYVLAAVAVFATGHRPVTARSRSTRPRLAPLSP